MASDAREDEWTRPLQHDNVSSDGVRLVFKTGGLLHNKDLSNNIGGAFSRRAVLVGAAALPILVLSIAEPAAAEIPTPELLDSQWNPEYNEGQAQLELTGSQSPVLSRGYVSFDQPMMRAKYLYYVDYAEDRSHVQLYVTSDSESRPRTFDATVSIPGFAPSIVSFSA